MLMYVQKILAIRTIEIKDQTQGLKDSTDLQRDLTSHLWTNRQERQTP